MQLAGVPPSVFIIDRGGGPLSVTKIQSPAAAGSVSTRIPFAALAVAALDAAFGIAQCRIFNPACTVETFFRGIASFAPGWFLGHQTSVLGVVLHLAVAGFWTTAYALTYQRSARLRRLSSTWPGLATTAFAMGILVWLVMDTVVLPVVGQGRHTPVGSRTFWIILAGHPLFVGLPIAAIVRHGGGRDA